MTKRWSATASGDGQTKREASKAARREIDYDSVLCSDGDCCSDPWCLRLGCSLTRGDGEYAPQKSED